MKAWLIRTFDISEHSRLRRAYRLVTRLSSLAGNRIPGSCRVRVRGRHNTVDRSAAGRMRRVAVRIEGNNNSVTFGPGARLQDCHITISGDGNRVQVDSALQIGVGVLLQGDRNTLSIGTGCVIRSLGLVCEDDGNEITLGAGTEIAGATSLAAIEGTKITIGSRCLFSGGVHARTGDSHSITDLNGKRVNPSADITIGDHVWVGMNVTILKGSVVADSCVIGAASVVTRRFTTPNCALGGNPARVIREEIDWRVERFT